MNIDPRYKSAAGEAAVMGIYDAALKNWSVPYETRCLPTRHGDTFVVASGDANNPALILLHGAGSNSAMWAADVRDYVRGYRVYAVDLPGEAGKSAANRPEWDSPAFADWLDDVLNALDADHATLVGISQGGWTALKYATTTPERVDKLVLMSPGGIVPDRPTFLLRAIGAMMLGKWGLTRMVSSLFGDQPVPDGVVESVAQITAQFKPRIGTLPIFSDDVLRRLTMPVLLLGGTKDIARDIDKIAARMRQFLPRLTVSMIQDGGHALLNTSAGIMAFLME